MLALIPPGTGETGLASQLAGAAANDTELLAIHGRQDRARRGDGPVGGPLMGGMVGGRSHGGEWEKKAVQEQSGAGGIRRELAGET